MTGPKGWQHDAEMQARTPGRDEPHAQPPGGAEGADEAWISLTDLLERAGQPRNPSALCAGIERRLHETTAASTASTTTPSPSGLVGLRRRATAALGPLVALALAGVVVGIVWLPGLQRLRATVAATLARARGLPDQQQPGPIEATTPAANETDEIIAWEDDWDARLGLLQSRVAAAHVEEDFLDTELAWLEAEIDRSLAFLAAESL